MLQGVQHALQASSRPPGHGLKSGRLQRVQAEVQQRQPYSRQVSDVCHMLMQQPRLRDDIF